MRCCGMLGELYDIMCCFHMLFLEGVLEMPLKGLLIADVTMGL